MRLIKRSIVFLLMGCVLLAQCKEEEGPPALPEDPDDEQTMEDEPPEDQTIPRHIHIAWNGEAKKISHDTYFAEYGRVHRVAGDTLLLVYHFGPQGEEWDNIALRKSSDNGNTWSEAAVLMTDEDPNYWGFATPELLVLENGSVMLAFVGRGRPDDNAHSNVQIMISHDRGWTWGEPSIVAEGRSWEPGMIQLPDGEIQLFYSSEARWWYGPGSEEPNQEILMIRSSNQGQSWTRPQTVAYTSNMRDGMPVPLVLQDDKGLVFAIESVRNTKSPWIVWSSLEAKWDYARLGSVKNNRRWLATAEPVWGGGPYLAQLESGETLLAIHDTGGRDVGGDWRKNTMLVLVGNSVAKNFTNVTYPFPDLPVDEGAIFNSLFLKDENTVVAISSRNFADGTGAIYWKEGQISREK